MHKNSIKMSPFRVDLSDVGLLGEIVIPTANITNLDLVFINDLQLKKTENFYLSRGHRYYYELTCFELTLDIFYYYHRINETNNIHIKYILLDHIFNGLLRILDILVIYQEKDAINYHIRKVQEIAVEIVNYLTEKDINTLGNYIVSLPQSIARLTPRVYLEGDNHLLTLISIMKIPRFDICVGILFGGAANAAIYSAYHLSQLNYIKISCYDDISNSNHYIWGNELDLNTSVLVLDDNCGTGKTLNLTKCILKDYYKINAKIAAIELHWEKLLRVKGYQHQDTVFDLEKLDYLTPWNVRHHNLLKQLIQQDKVSKNNKTTIKEWLSYSKNVLNILSTLGIHDSAFESMITYCSQLEHH